MGLSNEKDTIKVIQAAIKAGVNYFDLFIGKPTIREAYGKALEGIRKNVYIAGHLDCCDLDCQYVKSRDETMCIDFIEQFYEKLRTDYIDVLFLHNCDELSDLDEIMNGWMYKYAKNLKDSGKTHFICLSSHNTKVAIDAVKTGKIDVLLFRLIRYLIYFLKIVLMRE